MGGGGGSSCQYPVCHSDCCFPTLNLLAQNETRISNPSLAVPDCVNLHSDRLFALPLHPTPTAAYVYTVKKPPECVNVHSDRLFALPLHPTPTAACLYTVKKPPE